LKAKRSGCRNLTTEAEPEIDLHKLNCSVVTRCRGGVSEIDLRDRIAEAAVATDIVIQLANQVNRAREAMPQSEPQWLSDKEQKWLREPHKLCQIGRSI